MQQVGWGTWLGNVSVYFSEEVLQAERHTGVLLQEMEVEEYKKARDTFLLVEDARKMASDNIVK